MLQTDLADLVLHASEESPDRLAVVESGGRGRTWLQLEREVASFATGLGGLGILAGARVMLVIGNRLEFVTSYLGVLRAQVVVVPVNPRSTADELARMIADSGTRLVIADPAALEVVRAACAQVTAALDGAETDLEADLVVRAHRPRIVAVDSAPGRGRGGVRRRDRHRGPSPAAAARPGEAGRTPLHERHVRATARGDAHPPCPAGQPGRRSARSSRR